MRRNLPALLVAALLALVPRWSLAEIIKEKEHDFIPRVHNVIFLLDVSDSMTAGYPETYDLSRIFVASRAFMLFDSVMPHVPRWQYDVNTAVIAYGDCTTPRLVSPLGPWTRGKYKALVGCLRQPGGPWVTAALQDALQLSGSLIATAAGRTAIVVFTDGGNQGECPQKTAIALKDAYGDKVQVYGIFFGDREIGWRNLYETCKLTGGYARHWEDVRSCPQMKDFAWDITVREIMFPYPEIFFQDKTADLLPSEALKLESVANFLHAIPQYMLQIDGHTSFIGNTKDNYQLALARANNVKEALVTMYKICPSRILVRSFGEELPRYDNQNPDVALKNHQANLYLNLPLRNYPYDEKRLHTFGVNAVGDVYNTQERDKDKEWAWPAHPVPPPPPVTGRGMVEPGISR
ncbi:MAG TPA: OmpA family protein [Desulfomonilaceae bacterium]|nr:OmpA family protein [Desulfomonilaceae bacterium]